MTKCVDKPRKFLGKEHSLLFVTFILSSILSFINMLQAQNNNNTVDDEQTRMDMWYDLHVRKCRNVQTPCLECAAFPAKYGVNVCRCADKLQSYRPSAEHMNAYRFHVKEQEKLRILIHQQQQQQQPANGANKPFTVENKDAYVSEEILINMWHDLWAREFQQTQSGCLNCNGRFPGACCCSSKFKLYRPSAKHVEAYRIHEKAQEKYELAQQKRKLNKALENVVAYRTYPGPFEVFELDQHERRLHKALEEVDQQMTIVH